MGFAFILCPECLARYGALRFDPTASYGLCSIPLCSLVWADEHPDGVPLGDPDGPHQQCGASVLRLAGARTQLWRLEKAGKFPARGRLGIDATC